MAGRRAFRLLPYGLGSVVLASSPTLNFTYKVKAASNEPCASGRNWVKITELPIYENPEDKIKYCFQPEEITAFRTTVSNIRKEVWDLMSSMGICSKRCRQVYTSAVDQCRTFLEQLQNDPGIMPRLTVIGIAGLGGVIAGYQGGLVRKVFYGTLMMGAAASLCYPNEAYYFSNKAYNALAASAASLFKDKKPPPPESGSGSESGDKPEAEVKPDAVAKPEAKAKSEAKPEAKDKSEAKPEEMAKSEAKPESKTKPEANAETKSDSKPKPDAKPEAKAETKSDSKPKPDAKPQAKPDTKPDAKPEDKNQSNNAQIVSDEPTATTPPPPLHKPFSPSPRKIIRGDEGQSRREDQDMYSTRSNG